MMAVRYTADTERLDSAVGMPESSAPSRESSVPSRERVWSRLALNARETLVVTLLTVVVVFITTLFHVSSLTRVTLEENLRHGELLARQAYGLSARALARPDAHDPSRVLRDDAELRGLLDSAIDYSPQAVYIAITDPSGRAIVHTDSHQEGRHLAERPDLRTLVAANAIQRIAALYGPHQTYEVAMPVNLDGRPFATIRVGIPLAFVKAQLYASLRHSAILGVIALVGAWLAALALSRLTLRPIRRLAEDMERLRRGEVDVGQSLSPKDDFGRLAFQLQLLGRQIDADRAEMRAQSSRYQRVVDQLEDGLAFVDADGRLQFANRAATVILGRFVAEGRGRVIGELLEPEHPLRGLIEQALNESVTVQSVSIAIPVEGGASTECMVSVFPVPGDPPRSEGVLVLMKDLKAVAVSARTLQSLISYSAQVAALGRATSEVTHEVKNPLNAMTIHLRLLKDQLPGASDTVKKSLDIMQKQITRLDSVVQNFMNTIRPERLTLKPVDVCGLVKDLGLLLEAEWRQKGVEFALRAGSDVPAVQADEEALRTALMNVVLNACQAMPHGGAVTISVERQDPQFVAITVADTGTGIKPEDMDQIFRVSFTTKPEGSGIGMSVVRRLVDLHGGSLEIASKAGVGTTVVIRLPIR